MGDAALWSLIGYLLGSIPFGLLLTRMIGVDIRKVGSGNIGTTNVLRTGNKGLAAATLLLDAGKGAVAVLLARQFAGETAAICAGIAAFAGHCFPIWLKFRGGKGVATMLGIALAAVPLAGAAALVGWLGAALATRYSSLGGMVSALVAAGAGWALGGAAWGLALLALAVVLVAKHHENIARLRAGTEGRIGQK
ncbi:MAG: acyl-phosphate glycerol 3-phosphate acyltransferase [Alphaproteobacteria bacterium]|nr:MAG: acyl-phosphate glycerol 3-phosphate acyltransferase [Alphaproteobacteria bacterium]